MPRTLQALVKWPFHKSDEVRVSQSGMCTWETALRKYSEGPWQVRVKGEKSTTLERRDQEPCVGYLWWSMCPSSFCCLLVSPLTTHGSYKILSVLREFLKTHTCQFNTLEKAHGACLSQLLLFPAHCTYIDWLFKKIKYKICLQPVEERHFLTARYIASVLKYALKISHLNLIFWKYW